MSEPVVVAQQICKSFGSLRVLREVDLEVRAGRTLCILGPSGSGKSTLLRCLNFLERPDEGAVFLRGERVGFSRTAAGQERQMTDRELARMRTRMGMVFQQFNLWPHLTVLGNLIESPIHVQRRPRDEVVAEATLLLDKIGLRDKRDAYPSRLLGGQKQRVAIARALAMKPEVLLFDEPTSSLDPELVSEVLGLMRDLSREGQTMIVVTHELAFAREAADEVLFMDKGSVVETAPPNKFFGSPDTPRAKQFLQRFV
ncbi:amino acid ABC transporter ATP-binding protein [Bradyrhizobium sp. SRL28]|uniref:amino acid ABC transporter ATP-binding protein n=1 Tax=Bradyrhizobium sp. SRL28 TaxID=2836178 RepID=UPI001BDE2DAC|nr:amino acid ABC transporter ATP-binding protein [Bradyrhizobium sp. SRL28]MBT1516537.1 amino acid ABC transporter ATP-binding protein [Bradyrhizobium sp. SRL28]